MDVSTEEARPTGWYRDPEHPLLHRYWDGGGWRAAVAPTQPHRGSDELPAT